MRKLLESEVEFSFECLPEESHPRDHFASGEEQYDREDIAKVLEELEKGNEWGWCCIKVTAKWKQFTGSDFLGCCSYSSQKDFETDEYYSDMKTQALEALNNAIQCSVFAARAVERELGE